VVEKKEFIPTDLVAKLAGQGKSEPDIIKQMRAQGFTPSQIDKALKLALKEAVEKPQSLLRPDIGTEPEEIPEMFKPTRRPLMEVKEKESTIRPTHPEKMLVPPELHLAEIPVSEEPPKAPQKEMPAKEMKETPVEEETKAVPAKTYVATPTEHKPKHTEYVPRSQYAPMQSRPQYQPPAPTAYVKPPEVRHEITLEELVEQIVGEHAKKVEGQIGDFERQQHELQQRLTILEDSTKGMQSALDAHVKTSSAKMENIENTLENFSARFEALETAFKQFSDFMKKK